MSKKKEISSSDLVEVKPITDNQKLVFESYKKGLNQFLFGCAGAVRCACRCRRACLPRHTACTRPAATAAASRAVTGAAPPARPPAPGSARLPRTTPPRRSAPTHWRYYLHEMLPFAPTAVQASPVLLPAGPVCGAPAPGRAKDRRGARRGGGGGHCWASACGGACAGASCSGGTSSAAPRSGWSRPWARCRPGARQRARPGPG